MELECIVFLGDSHVEMRRENVDIRWKMKKNKENSNCVQKEVRRESVEYWLKNR